MKSRLLLCALPFAAAAAWATAERPLKATLTEATGDVQVKESDAAEWEPADVGMTLASGARIKTGADASADLLFEDGTALHADKNADLAVKSASEAEGGRAFSFRLWAGRLLSQVAKKTTPVKYSVRTPVAVAAVRGTEFVADATDEGTELAVFEGEVETQSLEEMEEERPLGEPVAVKPDQELTLERGRPAGMPRAISRAMSDYRARNASLFRNRIDGFRRDNARLRRLQEASMERRRRRIEHRMEHKRQGDADKMRDFRRKMRRRSNPPNGPRQ